MVLQRVALLDIPQQQGVIVCHTQTIDALFRVAVVPKQVQRLLALLPISPYTLKLQKKSLLYELSAITGDEYIYVRLPRNKQEREYCTTLEKAELWEVTEDEYAMLVDVTGEKVVFSGGTQEEQAAFLALWEEAGREPSWIKKSMAILSEGVLGLQYKTRAGAVKYPFPLFRAHFLSVFAGTKKQAMEMIFERLRQRYVSERNNQKVPQGIVVTPNLDHLRLLFAEKDEIFQQVYQSSFLQTPDGFPPLIQYGRASLGYQPQEQITGIELFMQLINKIGSESLPYTIYLVGGFGNIPYKTRDYFISIYPELANNFVGISTPPFGFLEKKDILDTIAKDIEQKKPDIIFAGMTSPTQERFIQELITRKVNFGIGLCVGRTIEMVAGYQKKEPSLIEKLHLSWIYRLFFGGEKHIKQRQRKRVYLDLKFVWETLFSSR